ncbi:hypothetical protein C8Q80DRAFT_1137674 [Daedaleopsis nitida]|nr:hypothetical protein C8Q80DRAFT_1137674 [Daedaleopsis nitida]
MTVGPVISPANTHVFGLWLQFLFTGAYYVYFAQCVAILRRRFKKGGLTIWSPLACGLFFVLTTLSIVGDAIRGYEAFSAPDDPNVLPNPSLYYRDVATPLSLMKNSIIILGALLSDAVIVYRTYVVWSGSYLATSLPFLLLLADFAWGIFSTWTLSQTKSGDSFILAEVTVRVRYFFVITFCVNVLCAGLICWKIWRVHFRTVKLRMWRDNDSLSRILSVIVESAILYCAYLFVLIITDSIGADLFFVFLDPSTPIVAIVYTLLIVRIQTPPESMSTHLPTSALQFTSAVQRSAARQSPTNVDIEISLDCIVHTDRESGDLESGTGKTYHDEHNGKEEAL